MALRSMGGRLQQSLDDADTYRDVHDVVLRTLEELEGLTEQEMVWSSLLTLSQFVLTDCASTGASQDTHHVPRQYSCRHPQLPLQPL